MLRIRIQLRVAVQLQVFAESSYCRPLVRTSSNNTPRPLRSNRTCAVAMFLGTSAVHFPDQLRYPPRTASPSTPQTGTRPSTRSIAPALERPQLPLRVDPAALQLPKFSRCKSCVVARRAAPPPRPPAGSPASRSSSPAPTLPPSFDQPAQLIPGRPLRPQTRIRQRRLLPHLPRPVELIQRRPAKRPKHRAASATRPRPPASPRPACGLNTVSSVSGSARRQPAPSPPAAHRSSGTGPPVPDSAADQPPRRPPRATGCHSTSPYPPVSRCRALTDTRRLRHPARHCRLIIRSARIEHIRARQQT